MDSYVGVKIISAEPMTMAKASQYFNRPFEVAAATKDAEGYRVVYEDGYESWSPKSVFDATYRKTDGLTFGIAIEALKKGLRVCRKGWNGKGQFIELATNISYVSPSGDISNVNHEQMGNKAIAFVGTSGVQLGWLASQADMLADDWQIVE